MLRIRALRDDMESTNNARAYLTPLDPGERYFAIILYKKDETSALHRTTSAFKPLPQLRLLSSRFQVRASTRVKGTSGALIEAVKQYLNLRISLAYYAIAQSPYALSEAEKIKHTD
jgi:hypothetical protein